METGTHSVQLTIHRYKIRQLKFTLPLSPITLSEAEVMFTENVMGAFSRA